MAHHRLVVVVPSALAGPAVSHPAKQLNAPSCIKRSKTHIHIHACVNKSRAVHCAQASMHCEHEERLFKRRIAHDGRGHETTQHHATVKHERTDAAPLLALGSYKQHQTNCTQLNTHRLLRRGAINFAVRARSWAVGSGEPLHWLRAMFSSPSNLELAC